MSWLGRIVLKIRPSKEADSTSSFQVAFWKQGGHTESEKYFHLGYQPFSGEDGGLTGLWCCYFHPLGTGMESSYFLRICCVHRKTRSEKNWKKKLSKKQKEILLFKNIILNVDHQAILMHRKVEKCKKRLFWLYLIVIKKVLVSEVVIVSKGPYKKMAQACWESMGKAKGE